VISTLQQLPAISWEYVVLAIALVAGAVKLLEVLLEFVAALVGRPVHSCDDGDVMELERIAEAVEELRDAAVEEHGYASDRELELERIREAVEHIRNAGDKLTEQLDERLLWATDTLCEASREQTSDIREHFEACGTWQPLTPEGLDALYPAPYSRQWWRRGFAGIADALAGVFRTMRRAVTR